MKSKIALTAFVLILLCIPVLEIVRSETYLGSYPNILFLDYREIESIDIPDGVKVLDAQFSYDDQWLALGLSDKNVRIYSTSNWTMMREFELRYAVRKVSWSVGGDLDRIAFLSHSDTTQNSSIAIYDTNFWALVKEIRYYERIESFDWLFMSDFLAVPTGNRIDFYVTDTWEKTGYILDIPGHVEHISWTWIDKMLAVSYLNMSGFYYVDYFRTVSGMIWDVVNTTGPYPFVPDVLEWGGGGTILVGNLSMEILDPDQAKPIISIDASASPRIIGADSHPNYFVYSVVNHSSLEFYSLSTKELYHTIDLGFAPYCMDWSGNYTYFAFGYIGSFKIWYCDQELPEDTDGDNVPDEDDDFPLDPTEWKDTDGDGVGDNSDEFWLDPNEWNDTDFDGVGDNSDEFPNDPTEWKDTDNDGYGDNSDQFPSDPREWNDTDSDGVGDNSDEFPGDPNEWNDTDSDGVGDNSDEFPSDPNEWNDADSDGYGDNSDQFPSDPNEWNDADSDGYGDNSDQFPSDPSEWKDSDSDGYGENSDQFPSDPNEWNDTDGDGVGNNGDAFPSDPAASMDTDADGYPDGWNTGYTEEDSTTGLVLDEYPMDSGRYKNEPNEPNYGIIVVPVIILSIIVAISLLSFLVLKGKDLKRSHNEADEYSIEWYRKEILEGREHDEIDDDEIIELLSARKRDGVISEEAYEMIMSSVLD